jgi:hypothetical protein
LRALKFVIYLFCQKTYRINKDRLLSEEEIAQGMRKVDELYEVEASGNVDEQYSIVEWINMLVNKYLVTFNIASEDTNLDFDDGISHDVDNSNYDAKVTQMKIKKKRMKEKKDPLKILQHQTHMSAMTIKILRRPTQMSAMTIQSILQVEMMS